ncbi:hypothetical protein [Lactobacillus plantarum] [Lactiplantibacillus mudanjiangensis]|uniref:hypothetical protein n=1 Tax=Lactiplantibacillus mudanjiangensis TaxID=1296538 RepID=UPI0010146AE7|nr:hypothetical protein [Lactobacillus plantarum] [Lactiplantibacillus mudanjiangensis]
MANWKSLVFTTAGQKMIADAIAEKQPKFTIAVASTDDHSEDSAATLANLTDISTKSQTVNVSRVIKSTDVLDQVFVTFPTSDVSTAYRMKTVGLYARLPDDMTDTLYAVGISTEPDYVAAGALDGTNANINLSFLIGVSADAHFEASITSDGMVTEQEADVLLEPKANDKEVTHPADIAMETLNGLSLEIDTSGLGINDYPRFVAHVYYNGAGIAQTVSYAGVPLMSELLMFADLKVNGQTMIPKFWMMQLKAAAPDFDTKNFTTNRSSDGTWMYIISKKPDTDQATIGIHCLNAKFKEVA